MYHKGSILITAQVEFFCLLAFFNAKKTNLTRPTQPLMRNIKALLTISFHQPKALPASIVTLRSGYRIPPRRPRLMEPRPLAAAGSGQAGPPSPQPRFPLPPTRYFTRARGCSGSGGSILHPRTGEEGHGGGVAPSAFSPQGWGPRVPLAAPGGTTWGEKGLWNTREKKEEKSDLRLAKNGAQQRQRQ